MEHRSGQTNLYKRDVKFNLKIKPSVDCKLARFRHLGVFKNSDPLIYLSKWLQRSRILKLLYRILCLQMRRCYGVISSILKRLQSLNTCCRRGFRYMGWDANGYLTIWISPEGSFCHVLFIVKRPKKHESPQIFQCLNVASLPTLSS